MLQAIWAIPTLNSLKISRQEFEKLRPSRMMRSLWRLLAIFTSSVAGDGWSRKAYGIFSFDEKDKFSDGL